MSPPAAGTALGEVLPRGYERPGNRASLVADGSTPRRANRPRRTPESGAPLRARSARRNRTNGSAGRRPALGAPPAAVEAARAKAHVASRARRGSAVACARRPVASLGRELPPLSRRPPAPPAVARLCPGSGQVRSPGGAAPPPPPSTLPAEGDSRGPAGTPRRGGLPPAPPPGRARLCRGTPYAPSSRTPPPGRRRGPAPPPAAASGSATACPSAS